MHRPTRQPSEPSTPFPADLDRSPAPAPSGARPRARPLPVALRSLLFALAAASTSSHALAEAPPAPSSSAAQPAAADPLCEPPSEKPANVDCRGATLARAQAKIDEGRHEEAIQMYSCVLAADPLVPDAYRGRSEAELLLGRYYDAFHEYALLTAHVIPLDPGAPETILANYEARLAARPQDRAALTGASFARWAFFDYKGALPVIDELLELHPDDVYGNLFRGSNRLFVGEDPISGEADLTRAILLAPQSRDVRYIVADAYTYALHDPVAAYPDARRALEQGLDTPRIHAILASALLAWGDTTGAAAHLERHIGRVTTDLVLAAPLDPGGAVTLDLVPGRTYELPIEAIAGQTIAIETDNPAGEIADSILVLFGPDGSPVHGGDDDAGSLACLDWIAPKTGTYEMWVTSFEAVGTGRLTVSRD